MSFSEACFPSESCTVLGIYIGPGTQALSPAREAGDEHFQSIRNCPQVRCIVKFRVRNPKLAITTVSHHFCTVV